MKELAKDIIPEFLECLVEHMIKEHIAVSQLITVIWRSRRFARLIVEISMRQPLSYRALLF
jgi:hypothetical protein